MIAFIFDDPGSWVLAIALVCVGVFGYAAVRGFRMAVVVNRGTVEVRGLLRTRKIPAGKVFAISRLPSLRWVDGRGRRRRTPLVMFAETGRPIGNQRRHNRQSLERISRMLGLTCRRNGEYWR